MSSAAALFSLAYPKLMYAAPDKRSGHVTLTVVFSFESSDGVLTT